MVSKQTNKQKNSLCLSDPAFEDIILDVLDASLIKTLDSTWETQL